jgi:hypothetical protein
MDFFSKIKNSFSIFSNFGQESLTFGMEYFFITILKSIGRSGFSSGFLG